MLSSGYVHFWSLLLLLLVASGYTQEQSDDTEKCAQDLIDWCQKRKFSNSQGLSLSSSTHMDNEEFVSIICTTDAYGTECKRNRKPWFECFPNKTVTYKGNPLADASSVSDGGDDGICEAAKKAMKLSNTAFNRTAFEMGMRKFQAGMQKFHQEMEEMQNRLRNMFSNGFPFNNRRSKSGGTEHEMDTDP